jgi:uncharacterized membrane protein YfhO
VTQHIVIEKRSNSAASISIVLAIIGFVFSLIPFLGWLMIPVWLLAILFGFVGIFRQYKRGLAIAGIAIGLFTFVYKISFLQALFG